MKFVCWCSQHGHLSRCLLELEKVEVWAEAVLNAHVQWCHMNVDNLFFPPVTSKWSAIPAKDSGRDCKDPISIHSREEVSDSTGNGLKNWHEVISKPTQIENAIVIGIPRCSQDTLNNAIWNKQENLKLDAMASKVLTGEIEELWWWDDKSTQLNSLISLPYL